MCILITKQRGAQFPPVEYIKNSIENNPDGFAMAWNEDGELKTYKTMSARSFLSAYCDITASLDPAETGMIIHARIMTHGARELKNCHCWKSFIGTDDEMAFAHNGILSVPNRDGMTDSETFLRDYFEPAYIVGGWLRATNIISRKIGSSKFAFINRLGYIRRFGQFISDRGCYYSNASYARSNSARCADPRFWTSKYFAI